MILIIDDSKAWAKILARILGSAGYETNVIDNGTDGIYSAIYGNYELIIVDYRLPDVDGIGVATAIRQNGITTPIFLISGEPDSIPEDLKGVEFSEIIGKPIMATDLVSLVNKHTGKTNALSGAVSDEILKEWTNGDPE